MEFDNIRFADQPDPQRTQRHSILYAYVLASLGRFRMHLLVQNPSLRGKQVFAPRLFDMDQRALAPAEQKVLKRGNGQKVVFRIGTPRESSLRWISVVALSPSMVKINSKSSI